MQRMSRLKAFSTHLGISATIAAVVIALMLLVWYAPPFFSALDGKLVLMVLLGVDVTVGPLFTLLLFNPKKTRLALTVDVTMIALLQTAALLYGMHAVLEVRPVFVVFSKGSFDLVTANMLSKPDIAKAKIPAYRSLSYTGPVYVYSEMPTDVKEENEVVLGAFSGKDLPQFPQFYQPLAEHMPAVAKAARPLAALKQQHPDRAAAIDEEVRANGLSEADLGFVLLRAKHQDQAFIVRKADGKMMFAVPM